MIVFHERLHPSRDAVSVRVSKIRDFSPSCPFDANYRHSQGRTLLLSSDLQQPKQVAEWAGNSVEVLLRTYAKCLVGQDEISMRRISEALN